MLHLPLRGRYIVIAGLGAAALLFAQDWKTLGTLPAVDFSRLTPAKKNAALRILRNHNCECGCDMKVAECRVKDPNCAYSKGLSAAITDTLRAGKSESDAVAAAKASRWGHAPAKPKLLDDPVTIPVANSPAMGPANARITLVEFSDFQCPYCIKAVHQLEAVLKAYPSQVKLIFKEFPLDSHSQAFVAATAAIAAHHQGKFWAMHDIMFANRQNLAKPAILALAGRVGVDLKRFEADMDSPETRKEVQRDLLDGEKAGVEGTPTIFIDGQRYNGSLELDALKPILDGKLKSR